MIAVYNLQGRIYSGPLEQRRRVEASAQSLASRRVADNTVSDEGDRFIAAQDSFKVSKSAIDNYRSMLENSGQPEPVCHAYQIMSKGVEVLQPHWPLERVEDVLQRSSFQLYPVVNELGLLRATLSRQQFYEFMLSGGDTPGVRKRPLEACLLDASSKAFAVDPVTDVRRVARLLHEENLCALPVVLDTGKVLGIVSRTDILRCAIQEPPLSLWC